jgi:hypothetical protein
VTGSTKVELGDPLVPGAALVLGTSSVQVAVRPRRVAFAVTSGDTAALRRAILAASTIWGGARCPVLPVTGGNRIVPGSERLASFLHVDEVLDYRLRAKRPIRLGSLESGLLAVRSEPPLEDDRYWAPHPMAVNDPEAIRQRRLLLGRGGGTAQLAALGDVALAEEEAWWKERGAVLIEASDANSFAWAQVNGETVLEASVNQDVDRTIMNSFLNSMALVVVAEDEEDFNSIVAFWNLRALRPRSNFDGKTILITKAMADDEGVQNAIRKAVAGSRSQPSLALFSDTVSAQWLRARIRKWGFDPHQGTQLSERLIGTSDQPITARVLDPRVGWLVERRPGETSSVSVAWERPTTSVRFPSPVRWNFENAGAARVHVLFSGTQFDVPRRNEVARVFHENAVWEDERLRLTSSVMDVYDFPLSLPSGHEVIDAVLRGANASASPSDKAIQIQGAISAVSDPAIFRERPIVRAIQALVTPGGRDLRRLLASDDVDVDDKVATVLAATAPAVGLEFSAVFGRVTDTVSKLELSRALDTLVRNNVVERGFQTECSLCGLRLFTDLTAGQGHPACSGCGQVATLVGTNAGEPLIHYRLRNLGHRLSLNGGLAPLAAMQVLLGEGAYVLPGANIKLAGGSAGEFDLLGWHRQTVFAGEAKTSAKGFAEHDLSRDTKRAAAIGADQYLLVCLDAIGDETRERAANTTEAAGLSLRILDGSSIFS